MPKGLYLAVRSVLLGFRGEAGFSVFFGVPFGSLFEVILHPVLRLIGQNVPGDLKKGSPKTLSLIHI